MKLEAIVATIVGSGVLAALLSQLFEGLRLKRQFTHERRLRLDDERRKAYFDLLMWLDVSAQRAMDGFVASRSSQSASTGGGDEANRILRTMMDEMTENRNRMALYASDQVAELIDKEMGPAVTGYTGAIDKTATDAHVLRASLGKAKATHLAPFIKRLREVMAEDFRD